MGKQDSNLVNCFFFMCNSPSGACISSLSRVDDHTQTHHTR